jgi:hypothetical protein
VIYLRSTAEIYEQARAAMDNARGLPAKGQVTSFVPAAQAPSDDAGRVHLALRDSDLTAPGADDLLHSLLASGAVEQVTKAEYDAAAE